MKLSQRRMARPSLGGMLATRQGALILAVLCAACAAGVMVFALNHYKASVRAGVHPAVTQATVLVAAAQIQKGTSGDLVASEKLYKSTPIIASELAPGAISDSGTLHGKVAQTQILPGQQLTSADFAAVAGVGSSLAPNERAVSVNADAVHGDLSVIVPGDHVDIYASMTAADATTKKSLTFVSLLQSDVLVLKTPASGVTGAAAAPAGTAAPAAGGSLVFAVKTPDVQGLEMTVDSGHIWVALRPANATAPAGGVTTAASILADAIASAPTTPPTSNQPTGTNP